MSPKILLVDDEEAIRQSLGELLKLEGYEVTLAENGNMAVNLLQSRVFDLVLLDLKMPGMSGLEVLYWINAHVPDTKVIFLTAYGTLESAIEALRYGVHDYLLKPVSSQEILQSIRKALTKSVGEQRRRYLARRAEPADRFLKEVESDVALSGSASGPIELKAGVYLDLARREIRSGDQRIALTPTEGRLLRVFLENKGKVLTHHELVSLVQGYETADWEAPGILRPLVSRLRDKLSAIPDSSKWITSVRGTGYLFEIAEE